MAWGTGFKLAKQEFWGCVFICFCLLFFAILSSGVALLVWRHTFHFGGRQENLGLGLWIIHPSYLRHHYFLKKFSMHTFFQASSHPRPCCLRGTESQYLLVIPLLFLCKSTLSFILCCSSMHSPRWLIQACLQYFLFPIFMWKRAHSMPPDKDWKYLSLPERFYYLDAIQNVLFLRRLLIFLCHLCHCFHCSLPCLFCSHHRVRYTSAWRPGCNSK